VGWPAGWFWFAVGWGRGAAAARGACNPELLVTYSNLPYFSPLCLSPPLVTMSLFGDSPPARSRSSLFADEEFESAPGSLFEDSGAGAWNSAGLPTTRRGAPTDISKTLLTKENANIPERYNFLYESFLEQFGSPDGNGITLDGVKQVLKEADADGYGVEDKILSILMKGGKQSIGREEFYVLLALVGLEQQGEEVTIDGVDDSRRSIIPCRLTVVWKRE